MDKVKRILSLLLAMVLTISLCPIAPRAHAAEAVALTVETVSAAPGSTVDVDVNIANNPGILGAKLKVTYDSTLTLVNATKGTAFSALEMTKPGVYVSGCNFVWDAQEIHSADIKDGVILTLTFQVPEKAASNQTYKVSVSAAAGDIFDADFNDVATTVKDGGVVVQSYILGDVNSDTVVNTKDVVFLRRHLAGGYNQTANEAAADMNGDGTLNSKDIVLLRRKIAGGYEPQPPATECSHEIQAVPYKEAACTVDGNIAYWQCNRCSRRFSDKDGKTEITAADTVIKAPGHKEVEIPAVAPTETDNGWTAGVKCSVCNQILVEPEAIDPLSPQQMHIEYVLADSDPYLESCILKLIAEGKEVNPNASIIDTSRRDTILRKIENGTIPGYEFQGWFLDTVEGAEKVDKIAKGESGNLKLYAKWLKKAFTVTYASDMDPVTDEKFMTYYTDKGMETLPAQHMDKYVFVGWSDKDGNIWKNIPAGTAKDLTLYANWASTRNLAQAVGKLGDPIILEDSENGLILFTYEIGTIKNVPLFTTLRLQCVNGLISTVEMTKETTISSEQAETIAQTIANATTNSASWTTESTWNETTEVSETYLDQTNQTREETEALARSSENTYNIGGSFGGSTSNTNTASGAFKVTGNQSHSDTTTTESGQNVNLSVDAKYSREKSGGVSLGIPIEGLNLGINAGKKSSFEIGAGAEYGNYVKNTESGTDSWSNTVEMSQERSKSKTSEKNWNNSLGFSNSSSVSTSNEVSNSISKLISQEYGYGKSYAEGGSNSEAQELATTESKSDEFSATITYYTSEINSTTTSFSSTGNTVGDYRMVMAGTVHVFAVVGYDIATSSYFVYTYNVLDEKTEEYLDYSYDGTFDDYETSIIPFEVPVFVNQYVNNRVAETDGLTFNLETGIYEMYNAPATDAPTVISIPSYYANDKGDGTYDSIKVNGISSGLLQGNTEIVGVVLGHHIKEIPDNAFAGCTSLKYVICPGVTKIGDNAFAGCTSLEKFTVSEHIVSVGENAFAGVPEIAATAATAKIAQAVASSGAEKITLDISKIAEGDADNLALTVGRITSFELWGKDREYKGLSLTCDAKSTVVNGVNVKSGAQIPLKLSSENVTLNRVSIEASGYAMLLTADTTNIYLNGTVTVEAASGNAVICRNLNLEPLNASVIGKLSVSGNLLVCGTVTGEKYITGGTVVTIDEATFEQYKKGMVTITFDPNGGTVDESSKTAVFGQPLGELPVPTREGFTFLGWFAEDGEKVTADTTLGAAQSLTVHAGWQSGWVKASEAPEGAEVLNSKWSYDLTSYTTSDAETLDGWTHYETVTSWGDFGDWSDWSATPAYDSDSRDAESKDEVTGYNMIAYNTKSTGGSRQFRSFSIAGKYSSYGCSSAYGEFCYTRTATVAEVSNATKVAEGDYAKACSYPGYNKGKGTGYILKYGDSTYVFFIASNISTTYYRYRDRVQTYTYHFFKLEQLESTEAPAGENISNVQQWVQYRA